MEIMTSTANQPSAITPPNRSSGGGAQTLLRGLDVLEAVADQPLTATELAERLGLTKSTAHRLASALADRGSWPRRVRAIGWGRACWRWATARNRPTSSSLPARISSRWAR
jgi:DNA-binding transcriptional ArsR family regulator